MTDFLVWQTGKANIAWWCRPDAGHESIFFSCPIYFASFEFHSKHLFLFYLFFSFFLFKSLLLSHILFLPLSYKILFLLCTHLFSQTARYTILAFVCSVLVPAAELLSVGSWFLSVHCRCNQSSKLSFSGFAVNANVGKSIIERRRSPVCVCITV